MSGGVDSAVAALLLREDGRRAQAVFLRMWPGDDPRSCCSPTAESRARDLADRLGLPFHVLDLSEEFEALVVQPFVAAYLEGYTPNPCVACNRFRFARLVEWADQHGLQWVASGHYARLLEDDGPWLARGCDPHKDQSYMLAAVAPQQLVRMRLPVGELTKRQVRALAWRAGLPSAEAAESQEVCFAVNGYRAFLQSRGVAPLPGRIVDEAGVELGRHAGHWHYTVGQRRGLALGGGEALYVLKRCAERNEVVVGPRARLNTVDVQVDELDDRAVAALQGFDGVNGCPAAAHDREAADRARAAASSGRLTVQLRYRSPAVGVASAWRVGARGARLRLATAFSAAAPGQAAVFYRGERVVGVGRVALAARCWGPNQGSAERCLRQGGTGSVIPLEARSPEPDDSLRTHGGQTC